MVNEYQPNIFRYHPLFSDHVRVNLPEDFDPNKVEALVLGLADTYPKFVVFVGDENDSFVSVAPTEVEGYYAISNLSNTKWRTLMTAVVWIRASLD